MSLKTKNKTKQNDLKARPSLWSPRSEVICFCLKHHRKRVVARPFHHQCRMTHPKSLRRGKRWFLRRYFVSFLSFTIFFKFLTFSPAKICASSKESKVTSCEVSSLTFHTNYLQKLWKEEKSFKEFWSIEKGFNEPSKSVEKSFKKAREKLLT